MGKLNGKIALITGGNSGIGLATAKLYRNEGAQVIITASSAKSFEKTNLEYGEIFDVVQTDVSKLDELDQLYAHIKSKYGKLDILFANAGIAKNKPTLEVTPEEFDELFNINVRGLFFTVAKALPILSKGSKVILTASVVSSKGFPGSSVYSATKAAVRNFARTWTAEIPVEQVRFNVLSPGPIETPIFDKMGLQAEVKSALQNTLPIKRFGRPEEMAEVALFLGSDESSYIAGAEIFADGGFGQV